MVDVFLLVVAIVAPLFLLALNFYLMVHLSHPDDKNQAYFPKALFLVGLLLCEGAVLMLPLDVANKSGIVGCGTWNQFCGGLRLDIAWQFVYMGTALFVAVLIPFAVFYYEADDGLRERSVASRWCTALQYTGITLFVILLALIVMFLLLNETALPVSVLIADAGPALTEFASADAMPLALGSGELSCGVAEGCTIYAQTLTMKVTFPVYVVALFAFVGWFLFVLYGGIGLAAMPMDLINAFVHRPRYMPVDIYVEQKKELMTRTSELLEIGEMIEKEMRARKRAAEQGDKKSKREARKMDRQTLNQFKATVYVLERDYEDLRICHNDFVKHNPLVPWMQLVAGIFTIVLSLLWLLHVGLYLLPISVAGAPVTLFLNEYFMWFDDWFPLFGTASVGVFAVYLLLCVVKGNFKFGMRFFLVSIHPVRVNGTLMNSMLVNLGLVLLCTLPVVQFCVMAFADYARLTDVEVVLGVQVKYLKFFRYLYEHNVFVYALFAMAFISALYLYMRPSDTPATAAELRDKLRRGVNSKQVDV